MKGRLFPLVALWLAAAGVGASADDPLEPPDLSEYVRWGPVRARPNVGIRNFGKDDNVFFATGDEPKYSDYRITLGGQLEGLVLFGDRAFLEFDERLNLTFYDKFGSSQTIDVGGQPVKVGSQNYTNQYLSSRVTFPFTGWGVYGDLDLIQTENRPTPDYNARVRQRNKGVGVGFVVELGWRTYAELIHRRSDWKVDERDNPTTAERLDRLEQTNVLRFNYRLTGLTNLTLDTSRTDYTFDYEPDRDSTETRILPGFNFGAGSKLSGSVEIGYAKFDMKLPTLQDFDTTIGEGSLVYRMGSGTTVRLDGGREVGFTAFANNTFYLNKFIGARVTHYFTPILGGTVATETGQLSYPQGTRVDDNQLYELGVLVRAIRTRSGKTIEYGITWRQTDRDSNIPFYDQTRSVWGINATTGF